MSLLLRLNGAHSGSCVGLWLHLKCALSSSCVGLWLRLKCASLGSCVGLWLRLKCARLSSCVGLWLHLKGARSSSCVGLWLHLKCARLDPCKAPWLLPKGELAEGVPRQGHKAEAFLPRCLHTINGGTHVHAMNAHNETRHAMKSGTHAHLCWSLLAAGVCCEPVGLQKKEKGKKDYVGSVTLPTSTKEKEAQPICLLHQRNLDSQSLSDSRSSHQLCQHSISLIVRSVSHLPHNYTSYLLLIAFLCASCMNTHYTAMALKRCVRE